MTHLEFIRSPEISRVLSRAATGAGVPLSIHFVQRNQEGTRVCGWGQCDACRAVSESPGGGSACRLSRTTASTMALRQGRPIAYVCHLGLACVAVAPFPDEGYVITLGPYCPMEEQRSLAGDVEAGFRALRADEIEAIPFSLEDIHRVPAASVPAVAEWLQESIVNAWATHERASGNDASESASAPEFTPSPAPSRVKHESTTGTLARDVAAALSAGSHARARALMAGHLEEMGRDGVGKGTGTRHARIASLTAATIEALGRAGVPLDAAWGAYAEFSARLTGLRDDNEILTGAVGVFSFLRRKETEEIRSSALPQYPELFEIVKGRILEGVTLEHVAAELGETPSAISHRLKRKFGMSFSEYVGRIRVDMAKQLIRRTKLSATDVAQRVGIQDQSNFAKLFKKIEGISPSAYRKAHGKQQ
jgi:AraC-like DNA-binding protein